MALLNYQPFALYLVIFLILLYQTFLLKLEVFNSFVFYPNVCFMKVSLLKIAMLVFLLPFTTLAQKEKVDLSVIQKINDEENRHSHVAEIAHYLTDVSGSRLTNSPGYKRASNWAVQTLQQWGLQAGLEPWGDFGKGWNLEHSYAALKAPYYQPIAAYPKAWSASTNGLLSAPVYLLDRIDSATIAAAGDKLKGKIVLNRSADTLLKSAFVAFAERYSDSALRNLHDADMLPRAMIDMYVEILRAQYKAEQYLKEKGALALLLMNPTGRDGTLFTDGTPSYDKNYPPTLPQAVVSTEDYLKIQRLLHDGAEVTIDLDIAATWNNDDVTGYNVIAEIPGSDPGLKAQVVMLGGHLDSWHSGTGATDNAAGCVVMMEAVRLIKLLGLQPKRTIRIALWGGEEQGLYGSIGYVKKHFGDPANMNLLPEQKNISAYFNLDNGSGKIRGIYLQNNESVRSIFNAWLQPYADLDATTITAANTGSTDHLSFDAVGIPGFQFIQDPLEYETRTHHSNMDTYDHLQIDDLKQAAAIVAGFIYNAAERKDMLPRKRLPKAERFIFDTDFPI